MKSKQKTNNKKKKGRFARKHGRQCEHGWFMVVDPSSQRIVSIQSQRVPENNPVVERALTRILHLYPNVNAFIMDRNCGFVQRARQVAELKQIKKYIIDKWHAFGRVKTCVCNPRVHRVLMQRLKGVNTQICEQTFARFREYSKVFNNLRAARHHFLVLLFSTKHNAGVDAGDIEYLNEYKTKRVHAGKKAQKRKSYTCRQ